MVSSGLSCSWLVIVVAGLGGNLSALSQLCCSFVVSVYVSMKRSRVLLTYEYFCFEVVCWQTTYFSYLFQFTMLQRLYFKSKRCKVKQKRSTSIPGLLPLPIKRKSPGNQVEKRYINKQTNTE